MAKGKVTSESVVVWSPSPVATQVNGEVVLMSMERSRCYGFDLAGSDVWGRLSGPIRVADLCTQLHVDYDASASAIEADVLELLNQLADEGLIEVKT